MVITAYQLQDKKCILEVKETSNTDANRSFSVDIQIQ